MVQLDPVQQRVIGVLIEKEFTVPDSYPLTESALLQGCNQKSNRDPEMSLEVHDINQAILFLREDGWISRVDGARSARFKHRVEERLNVSFDEMVILAELLIRGPQAPGALKPRVGRMGYRAEPTEIRERLELLARRDPTPLVVMLPKAPRERDHRWAHCLGEMPEATDIATEPSMGSDPMPPPSAERAVPDPGTGASGSSESAPALPEAPLDSELVERVERLENEVAELRRLIDEVLG